MSDKEDWKVGDRVQWDERKTSKEEVFYGGVITALTTATREKSSYRSYYSRVSETETYVSHATVKWDDGEEETLEAWDLDPEDSELERQFRSAVPEAQRQIDEKLELAGKYLDEAIQLSEQHGIPFHSHISFLSQGYLPASFETKWRGVSKELMRAVTDTYNEYDGWQHSAVC